MFAASLVVAATALSDLHSDRAAQIKIVEETESVSWHAAPHPRWAALPPGASMSSNGVKGDWKADIAEGLASGELSAFVSTRNSPIPDSFDSEANWPQCSKIIGEIRDQSNCGCCWAFAGAEAASDRMCISTNASLLMPLSAQDVCFCSSFSGCGGGMIRTPWSYIKSKGAVTGGLYKDDYTGEKKHKFLGMCSDFSLPHCHHHGPQGEDPYPAEGKPGCPSESSPMCPSKCDDSASPDHAHFEADKYAFDGRIETAEGEKEIMKMILEGGPVETAFTVYSDFEDYAGGIYHHVTGSMAGGHAVKIVGWGVEKGVKYWKVANSWNPYWGEEGYFRIRRGNNEGGIENGVVASAAGATWAKKSVLDARK